MDIVINHNTAHVPPHAESLPHQGNVYHHLLMCLGYPVDSPPLADLLRRYHGLIGQWFIASPIHWEATHKDAMIVACGDDLGLDDAQSRLWFSKLEAFAVEEQISLHYHDASTWLLQCPDKPPIHAKSPQSLLHQSMLEPLTSLDKTRYWQKFMTEIQMLFSMHSSFDQKTYTVNGLWIWGGGALEKKADTPLFCDQASLKLAQCLSSNVNPDLTSHAITKNSVLWVDRLSEIERLDLERRFQNRTVRWYWNNRAYITQPKRWITRLMEKF